VCGVTLSNSWQGENWNVKIMYSKAGVATQILISTLECDLLVDVGDGALRDLLELDYNFERLKAIAITHGHFDHMGGLWTLLCFMRMIGKTGDLFLITPHSCTEVEIIAKGFTDVYGNLIPFRLIVKELSNREKTAIEEMEIQAFPVIHKGSTKVHGLGKRIPALGYSIRYNDQRVVISGDTGMCQSLKELVKNADLAILEASAKQKASEISEVHLSIEEAREIGKTAKAFILIHQWP